MAPQATSKHRHIEYAGVHTAVHVPALRNREFSRGTVETVSDVRTADRLLEQSRIFRERPCRPGCEA